VNADDFLGVAVLVVGEISAMDWKVMANMSGSTLLAFTPHSHSRVSFSLMCFPRKERSKR